MSINEAYILLRTEDTSAVADATEAWLVRWQKETLPGISSYDNPADWGIGEFWEKEYMLLPAEYGWTLVLDRARRNSHPDLARHLSALLKCTAVWCQVLGECYFRRHIIIDKGRDVQASEQPKGMPPFPDIFAPPPEKKKPAEPWSASVAEPRGASTLDRAMPRFHDVEAETYAILAEMNIPPKLRLVDYDIRVPPEVAKEADIHYFGWVLGLSGLKGGIPEFYRKEQPLVEPSPLVELPVRFDGVSKDRRGRRYFLERRRVWGEPAPTALEQLLDVELDIRNRYEYPFLGLPDAAAPVVRFRYSHPNLEEADLKQRLAVRRRAYERVYPSKRQFLALAFKVLRKRWPQFEVADRVGFGCRLEADAALKVEMGERESTSWVVRLDNAYQEYRRDPGDLTPSGYLIRFFERLFGALGEGAPKTWEEAAQKILPRLRCGEDAPDEADGQDDDPCLDHIPTRRVANGLWVSLVYERMDGLFQVSMPTMKAWAVNFDTAFEAALSLLRSRTAPDLDGAGWTEQPTADGGRIWTVSYEDGNAATRVLLPDFRAALLKRLGDGEAVVSFPDRAVLRVVAASDPFGIEALRDSARRAFQSQARGQAPGLFRITADALTRYESWPDA